MRVCSMLVGITLLSACTLTATPPSRVRGVALMKQASQQVQRGQHRAAIETYDRAAQQLPQIAGWINVFAASSAAELGDTVQVFKRLAKADSAVAVDWGWRMRVTAFAKAGANGRALELVTAAAQSGSTAKRAAAILRIADLQKLLGNDSARRTALINAMQIAPASDAAHDAARALIALSGLSPDEHLLLGRVLMRSSENARGVREMQIALDSGITERVERAQAMFEVGRGKYRLGDRAAGQQQLQSVANDFAGTRGATRALFFLADLAHDNGTDAEALNLFQRVATAPVSIDETPLAIMRMGTMAYVQRDYAKAAGIFNDFRTRYSSGYRNDQATYWAALSEQHLGNTKHAQDLLRQVRDASPLSYYGVRAAQLLDISPLDLMLAAPPAHDESLQPRISMGLDKWQLLRDVDQDDAASYELRILQQRFPDNSTALYAIAEQLQKRDAPHLAIGIGRGLIEDGARWNERLLRIMYPLPYKSLIQREARARGLDPYFVAALIRQESRFNNAAISGSGAVGLMQVMPATGKQLRRKTGVGRITVSRLTQPAINIKLGTRFLGDLMRMYDSRVDIVLVAYNAGPARASRWRSFPEFESKDLFVERIPFDETRDYVKVVQLNTAIYRALYSDKSLGD